MGSDASWLFSGPSYNLRCSVFSEKRKTSAPVDEFAPIEYL